MIDVEKDLSIALLQSGRFQHSNHDLLVHLTPDIHIKAAGNQLQSKLTGKKGKR